MSKNITEEGKKALKRFAAMDPSFSEAASSEQLPTQKRKFNPELTQQVNEGARPADWVGVFTDDAGEIKYKMNLRKMAALHQWDQKKLNTTYGIDRKELLAGSAFLITRQPRDPAVTAIEETFDTLIH